MPVVTNMDISDEKDTKKLCLKISGDARVNT